MVYDNTPLRISVIDVVAAIMGRNRSNAAVTFTRLKNEHPDVTANFSDIKFPDARGRKGQSLWRFYDGLWWFRLGYDGLSS